MADVATDKLGLIKENMDHVFTYLENLEGTGQETRIRHWQPQKNGRVRTPGG